MKKTVWIVVFIFLLFADLLAIYLNNDDLRTITKPALMPVLAIYFLTVTKAVIVNLKVWIFIALFFSWVGDVLLLLEDTDPIFFLLGLLAFLVALVFYIVFFHNIRMREFIRGNALLLLVAIVYYGVLISILSPFLGNLILPVRIYGVVLSFMLLLAMHMIFSKNKKAGVWMMAGAILFVISDSLLAFNKFYATIDYAGIVIMFAYGLAQFFITHGAAKYINEREAP